MVGAGRLKVNRLVRGGLAMAAILLVASALVILVAYLWLKPPSRDLFELFTYLLLSGGISLLLGLGWLTYASQRVPMRLHLIVTYLVGAAIVLINVLVSSYLMFLSTHDLSLLFLLLIFSGVVSIFFALFVSRQLTRQVRQLSEGANSLAAGKLDTRVMAGGSLELAQLSEAFNGMAEKLQSAFEKQQSLERARKELVAAISHDLRTPLSSIRLMSEAITDGVTDERQTKEFLERIRGEVIYMSGLIEDLFQLSQLDAGALKLNLEPGNLGDLISDTLGGMRAQAESKKLHLEGEIRGELPPVNFDLRKIQRVLNNLVSNAIRYTPEGGCVTISAGREGDYLQVSVRDTGEGIASSDLEHIFKPFYRGERSRGREHGGAGLGLAIAKGLVELHGGSISVSSAEGQGSCFTFSLPLRVTGKKD